MKIASETTCAKYGKYITYVLKNKCIRKDNGKIMKDHDMQLLTRHWDDDNLKRPRLDNGR